MNLGGTCLLCFRVNIQTFNIVNTPLQAVYEFITSLKVDLASYCLCFICFRRLHQLYRHIVVIKQSNCLLQGSRVDVEQNILHDFSTLASKSKMFCELVIKQEREKGEQSEEDVCQRSESSYTMAEIKIERENSEGTRPEHYCFAGERGVKCEVEESKSRLDTVQIKIEADTEDLVTKEELGAKEQPTEVQIRPQKNLSNTKDRLSIDDKFGAIRLTKRIRDTGVLPFNCEYCDREFTFKSYYVAHVRTHTGEKPYSCDECDRKFLHIKNLKSHKRTHTGEKPFGCDVCKRHFTDNRVLFKHKRTHTGEKRHSCDICNRKFSESYHLITHKRVHTGEKPYECDICERKFSQTQALKSHRKTHTGEKPYICNICDRKFISNSNLTSHYRMHTGERPYECSCCKLKFKSHSNLVRHKITHTSEKPFACDACQRKFATKAYLKIHLKTHLKSKTRKVTKSVTTRKVTKSETTCKVTKSVTTKVSKSVSSLEVLESNTPSEVIKSISPQVTSHSIKNV